MDNLVDVFRAAELIFGIAYMLFGHGPKIPHVPRFWIAMMRLLIPLLMFGLALIQSANEEDARLGATPC